MTHWQLERMLLIGELNAARTILAYVGTGWAAERFTKEETARLHEIMGALGDFVNGLKMDGVNPEGFKFVGQSDADLKKPYLRTYPQ